MQIDIRIVVLVLLQELSLEHIFAHKAKKHSMVGLKHDSEDADSMIRIRENYHFAGAVFEPGDDIGVDIGVAISRFFV